MAYTPHILSEVSGLGNFVIKVIYQWTILESEFISPVVVERSAEPTGVIPVRNRDPDFECVGSIVGKFETKGGCQCLKRVYDLHEIRRKREVSHYFWAINQNSISFLLDLDCSVV